MTPLSRSIVLGAIAWVGLASTAWGQACAPTNDRAAFYLRTAIRKMSTDTASGPARISYQVPSVDSTTIVAVTQNQTCQKLLAAFNAAAPISPTPIRIYAVKVGTVYVATYPMFNEHYWPMVVLDSKYKLLTKTVI